MEGISSAEGIKKTTLEITANSPVPLLKKKKSVNLFRMLEQINGQPKNSRPYIPTRTETTFLDFYTIVILV